MQVTGDRSGTPALPDSTGREAKIGIVAPTGVWADVVVREHIEAAIEYRTRRGVSSG